MAKRLPASERKAQLLDTAAAVFAKYGYSGTTTAELAKAAGVSEPIIYRHFKNKKELFIALVEQSGKDTIDLWEKALAAVADPADRLRRLIGGNPMVTLKGNVRYRVIVAAMTEVEEPEVQKALQQHIARLHEFISREIRRSQASDAVSRRFSPELTAWALIQIGLGYGTLAALGVPNNGQDNAGNHVDDIIGLFMLGERYKK
ncbi:MAG: TetR/AcrR family transcriptional regulator [Phycisphaerales bacterium]|nr:TetR/AcrR family transcriptional regulator [Phycisphaerales bacterium]